MKEISEEEYALFKKRIQKLAEQAGFVPWSDEEWKPEGAIIDWSSDYDNELAKFAELIVRECADVLDKRIAPPNHPMNSLGYKLKQHFGVEE